MNDEPDKRLDELFAAARLQKPDTSRLEYGFETRLMARLRGERDEDAPWYACAWRLSPVFAAIVVALGIWSYCSPQDPEWQAATAVGPAGDETQMADYLTGRGI